jgi:hypothetical protein
MARKKVKSKFRKEPTPDWLLRYLTTGKTLEPHESGAMACYLMQGRDEKIKEAWSKHKTHILRDWEKNRPGTRPWAWWRYSAPRWSRRFHAWLDGTLPEPRKRFGGKGTPDFEVLACVPRFNLGIPTSYVDSWMVDYYNGRAMDIHGELIPCKYKEGDFKGVAIDPDDPPVYESEALYLQSHGLLLKTEENRLSGADYEPVSVLDMLEEQV